MNLAGPGKEQWQLRASVAKPWGAQVSLHPEPLRALRLKDALVGTLPAALTAVVLEGSQQHVFWERLSMATLWDNPLEDRGPDAVF